MADRTESPTAVKVEEHSHQCVILTYFHGDIGSMVDAHFRRALSKACKAKAPAVKPKKIRKPIKTEESSVCGNSAVDSYPESQVPPVAGGHLLTFNPADDPPNSWPSFTGRTGEASGLSSLAYSLSSEGLSVTGQQYAQSLLNLLHSDRTEMGPNIASSSKPDLLPNWTVPQGIRESVDPSIGFEPGRHLEKKDLYWY